MLQFKLSAAHFAFQQARRRALERPFLLVHAAIFGYKRMTVFRTAQGRAAPVGREEMGVMSRRISSTHAWGEGDQGNLRSAVGRWYFVCGPPGWVLWVWRPRLTLAAVFFLDFSTSRSRAVVNLGPGF